MDEFSGRTYHEPGTHISLPLLMLPGLVLVPGQTLPLHLFQPQVIRHMFTLIILRLSSQLKNLAFLAAYAGSRHLRFLPFRVSRP